MDNSRVNFFIVVNLHAASNHAKYCLKRSTKYLNQLHQSYQVFTTPPQGAQTLVKNLVNRRLQSQQKIIVIGGDGTLNQAINGVKQSNQPNTPLAYLPAGSGNDFARALNYKPHHEKQILQNLCHHPTSKALNLGQVTYNQQKLFFINNFGIGFDANIIQLTLTSPWKKRFNQLHLSKLIYVSQIFKAFKRPTFSVKLTLNKQSITLDNIFLCVLANQPYFGGGVPLIPPADLQEKKLSLATAQAHSWKALFKLVKQVFLTGDHLQNPAVHHFILQKAHLQIDSQQFIQVDGELVKGHILDLDINCAEQNFWL